MKIAKRLLSIVLCVVLVLGLLPATAVAAEEIHTANITITKPVGGANPDFHPVSDAPDKYYIEDASHFYWLLMEGFSYPKLESDDTFVTLKRYDLRVLFRAKTGYTFADDCVFTINNEETGCWGNPGNEFRHIYWYASDPNDPTYTVSFDANGGTGSMASEEAFDKYRLPQNAFSPPAGQYFTGWLVGTYTKQPGIIITVLNDTTVKAVWKEIPAQGEGYTVTYVGGEGSGGSMEGKTDFHGALTLPECGFGPPAGKRFLCWQQGNDRWNPGDTIMISFDTTIYAIWDDVPQQPTTYTVAVSANDAAYGSVSGGGTYDENASVTVTAAPNSGYQFVKWTESGRQVSTDASYTFTATANRTLEAVFEAIPPQPVTYTVAVSANDAAYGSVSGGGTYNENASVTVTAAPNSGYQFVEWTENGQQVSTDASYTFTATADRALVAVFEAIPPQQPPAGHTHDYDNALFSGIDATHHWKVCNDRNCPDLDGSIKDKAPHADNDGDGHCDACYAELIKISFDANGGSGTMDAVFVTLLPGSVSYEYTLPANGFTAPGGKSFKCWSVGGSEKAAGETITVAADTTVTASWRTSAPLNPNPSRPSYPYNPNPAPNSGTGQFTAAKTFDGGVGLSVAVTILSAAGGAWLAKKKED